MSDGHAVLQVGVPELEDWIVARTRHYDARYLSSDPRFRHAHITVLAPLQRGEIALDAAFERGIEPFRRFMAERIDPDTMLALAEVAPQPAA